MHTHVPDSALLYGFVAQPCSTHTSRTMILKELSQLVDASPAGASYDDLRRLVVDENICMKATEAGRKETFRRLRELYALRTDCILYRALRDLWPTVVSDRPLLAVLCAAARDTLFRTTAPVVLEQPAGAPVFPALVSDALEAAYLGRYSPIIRAGFGRHVLSSWTQSGHLEGKTPKIRTRVTAGPAAAAYALLLGHLCGSRGLLLFDTIWCRVLDSPPSTLDSLAFTASQRGWLEYRRIADVVEITFSYLLRQEPTAGCCLAG